MELRRLYAYAVGRAHDHGAGEPAARARADAARVREDLLYSGVYEAHELYLGHRLHAVGGEPHRSADYPKLGKRRIYYPLWPELLEQSLSHPADAAVLP